MSERLFKCKQIFFYLMLTIELIAMLVDKSALPFYQWSAVFRATFALACVCVLLSARAYSKRDWILMIAIAAVFVVDWRVSGKEDLLRVALFVFACKEIDVEKALRYTFVLTTAGCALIMALSVTGVLGEIARTDDYRGYVETRYVFGFGHPNAFHCMALMQTLLWMYLRRGRAKKAEYPLLTAAHIAIFLLSDSRIGLLLAVGSIALFALTAFYKNQKTVVVLDGIAAAAGLLFSLWAATAWGDGVKETDFVYKVEKLVSGRLQGIWHTDKNAMLYRWLPFSAPEYNLRFDMGWVRLFYWYGYVAAALVVVLIALLMIKCNREKNGAALAWITCASLYTVVEAHLVSAFVGRNYLLLLAGAYLLTGRNERDG